METMNTILSRHPEMITYRQKTIFFNKDFEGKGLLNAEINKLYKKKLVITDQELTDIVINSYVIIQKMGKIRPCDWDISELKEHLNTSISYYYENNIHACKSPIIESKPVNNRFYADLNDKYPAKFRTQDGHRVRSRAECIIDDFLYVNNIVHCYEKLLPGDEIAYCDFYIPAGNGKPQGVYIEFWGLTNDAQYLSRREHKLGIYKKFEFPLIELEESDIFDLQEKLTPKLLRYNIRIL
jgi:hypothetical protein